jgi:predicted kinase
MPSVTLTIANVGAGKSTWARAQAKEKFDTVIINKDAIREMLFGEYGFKNEIEPLVNSIAITAAINALRLNLNVIFDETNLTKEKRIRIIKVIRNELPGTRIIYACFPMGREGLERRKKDPRTFTSDHWERVWNNLQSIYEEPSFNEGVDEIIHCTGGLKEEKYFFTVYDRQKSLCISKNFPFVLPEGCTCPSCRRDFSSAIEHIAGTIYVSSCPYCSRSFLD